MPDKEAVNPTDYSLEEAEDHIGDLIGGLDILGEAHTMTDSTDIPDTPTTGIIKFATAGHMRYASGSSGDGNYYATGRNTNPATSALTFTTSFQNVPGIAINLGIGTYKYHAEPVVATISVAL